MCECCSCDSSGGHKTQDELLAANTSFQPVQQQPYPRGEKNSTENTTNLLLLIKFPAWTLINANHVLERLFTTGKSPCLES